MAGVHKGDTPVLGVAAEEFNALPAFREHEVVRHLLFVVGQELFDQLAAVAEAQDEVAMFSVQMLFRKMPQNGPGAEH